jgi:hypothetical protein
VIKTYYGPHKWKKAENVIEEKKEKSAEKQFGTR